MSPIGVDARRCARIASRTRTAATTLAVIAALVGGVRAAQARKASREVLSYFSVSMRSGVPCEEWRIFDPVSRTDTLFRTCCGEGQPSGVYWDSTESFVEYVESDTLFRLAWEFEAEPWPVLQLPNSGRISDWWFNLDSLCWQASSVAGVPRAHSRTEPPFLKCHSELWQSDREGANWRIAEAETTDCGWWSGCTSWAVPSAGSIRRRPAIGLDHLRARITASGWGGTPESIAPPDGEPESRFGWYFIPLRSQPARGLALRLGRPQPNVTSIVGPLYLMDRRRGKLQLLDTPLIRRDEELPETGMVERHGFLVVTGIRTYVFDLATGAQIFHPPGDVRRAMVWIRRPAPARVDTAGLRRLRQRFR